MLTVRVGSLAGKRSHNSHTVVDKSCRLRTTVVDGRVVLLEKEQNSFALVPEEQELDAEHFTLVRYFTQVKIKAISSPPFKQQPFYSMTASPPKYRLLKSYVSVRILLQFPSRPSKLDLFKSNNTTWTRILVFVGLRDTMRNFEQLVAMFSVANRIGAAL
ncbi:hypothetical protein Y032_0265g667 [Ancylostoma ceylanicum]|uniref:Uncharacterized protein n=1 Tax=Ancylostoma ceylanicum TaxID=53326 RepID=A0A016SAL7_9BILA|nr:hypothetical protein Y032_0265g667 [Ancylostoma ceylanicum]